METRQVSDQVSFIEKLLQHIYRRARGEEQEEGTGATSLLPGRFVAGPDMSVKGTQDFQRGGQGPLQVLPFKIIFKKSVRRIKHAGAEPVLGQSNIRVCTVHLTRHRLTRESRLWHLS